MTREQEAELGRLMARAQAGDATAYERLLGELRGLASSYIRRRVGAVAWVDDATQDVLVSVHRSRQTWQPDRPLLPWFYAIVSSRLVDGVRRERRVRRHEVTMDAPLLGGEVSMMSGEVTWLARRDLRALLRRLAVQQRHVLVRLKVHGQTAAEAGAALGLTEGHVRVVAHRALRALQLLARNNHAIDG